jgi:23S rRNA (cytosine1962-C5)-methyltransferase
MYPSIKLQPKKEFAIKRLHPWIFSGALQSHTPLEDGLIVEIFDSKNEYLATGHFFNGSIAVKIFSYQQTEINADFWFKKLENAVNVRSNFFENLGTTNIFRLVHGEGDGMPGLILDFYNGVIVFQAHTIGMWQAKDAIIESLKTLLGEKLVAIYDKSSETLPDIFSKNIENSYLFGTVETPHQALENSNKFLIDWINGQKTGFFIDQRDNRKLLQEFSKGKKVLNTFCYSGGFSVSALKAGAELVHSVDSSKKAIELVNANVGINFENKENHQSYVSDVNAFLKENSGIYDVIILDPPAYAKNMANRHKAVQGYKRLNIEGIKHLAKGGILFTFSCSQVVDKQLFYDTIVAAALEVGRNVRVLHHISQGSDHPVNLFHPESSYLKGLVLAID